MSRLPQELYGEIISHIPDQHDIISVSLTSRSLHHEAEPFLWHTITIDRDRKDHILERLTYLSGTSRITRYIQSLKVVIRDESIVDLLRTTLQATSNLTALEISAPLATGHQDTLSLGSLAQDTTFQLHRLFSRLPISLSCREFFRRQTRLVDVEFLHNTPYSPAEFFSPTDLPSLRIISGLHNRDHFLEVLLLGRKVTHLKCSQLALGLSQPYESLVVLSIGPEVKFASDVGYLFPNLRYICFHFKNKDYILTMVKSIPNLKYARMFYVATIGDYRSSALFARELFDCNPWLEGVEMTYYLVESSQTLRWKLAKDCDVNVPASPPRVGVQGNDDWKHWESFGG